MTRTARSSRQSSKVVQLRKGASLEMVRLACPDSAQASLISESFGLPVIDSDGIRDLHRKIIIDTADSLNEGLGERAMQIHLQRIVGSYVGSAHGAGQFYSRSVSEARDATARNANDARDADRTSNRVSAPARWLAANPMGVPTERDLVCESKWRPVYRFVVVRRPTTPP